MLPMVSKESGKALFSTIMSQTYCTRGSHWWDCTSGWQRIGFGTPGRGALARVGHLMILEEGELGTWAGFKVLKWLVLPTLTSW